MFGKSKPSIEEPTSRMPRPGLSVVPNAAARAANELPAAAAAKLAGLEAPSVKPSIISDAVSFVGEITSRGAIHIDGDARGTVTAESLTIGAGGALNGKVACRKLYIKGRFQGSAVCDELTITEEARVEGSLGYRTILMQKGAQVTGELLVIDDQ
jgi:cytoskeletal protein CcmA (bactofilin family)